MKRAVPSSALEAAVLWGVVAAWITLYAVALIAGHEPEVALVRASVASALLMLLARVVTRFIDSAPVMAQAPSVRELSAAIDAFDRHE